MFKHGKRVIPNNQVKVPTAYWVNAVQITDSGARLVPKLIGKFDSVNEAQSASQRDWSQKATKNVTPIAAYESAVEAYKARHGHI